ncbi:DUF5333 domain-containing protein [Jannaschia sp. W003]|uniref:DUF5333 domain-containing protein n=1 Tax=Jannaschia sp. W003 TaxID=2867012 RepID=UPI0021A9127B|nr:DUF5333 domain-containing protein [Jannaschia sp. W003]UWQ22837.1 DUF5333 domain-containing protein [Jannaschia sp. W003]
MTRSLLAALAIATVAAPASAGLRDERAITEGLITIGIAYEISERCASIDARRFRGIAALLSLRNEARALGYSGAEIEAFIDDRAEKDRLEAIARGRLAKMGAPAGDAEAHCRVGRAEAARGSAVGQLLDPR